MKKLIIGYGYLGSRVGQKWLEQGHEVFALTRRPERADQLAKQGIVPFVGDVCRPESLPRFPEAATLLYAVGYDRKSAYSLPDVYVEGLRHVLLALPDSIQRVLHISSTGVYGQTDGSWVDESSPCDPLREGGKACLKAEQLLQEHPLGERAVILRLAGIYGPGRIPLLRRLQESLPIPAAQHGHLNLIYIDDAVRAVLAAEHRAQLGKVYLVSDGHPCQRGEFYRELSRICGASVPTFEEPPPGSAKAKRSASDKRVRNSRMICELGVGLSYPTFRDGLAAIVAGGLQ